LDVTDAAGIEAFREQLHRERGTLDGVINNAGIVHGGEFTMVPVEKHLQTVEVNVNGLMRITHAFLSDLTSKPESYLVNLISASAFIPLPLGISYAASKWAVLGFTESLREELRLLGHRGVRVVSVCPSYIATGMFDGASAPAGTWLLKPDAVADRIIRAMEKNRAFVVLPWTVRFLTFLKGLMPRGMYYWFLRTVGANTSMKHWQGRKANGA
jgi:short-subunit dehydrogenase